MNVPLPQLGGLQVPASFSCLFPSGSLPSSTSSFLTEYNISAAAISIFSLAFMILGTLCLITSCTGKGGKGRDYLLKPAGMFYAFAGRKSAK